MVSEPVDEGDEYHAGEDIEIAVTFSKPVTVTGTPGLSLLVGTSTRTASYARTTGGATLVFSYTVASTDSDDDGVSVPENALSLNQGHDRRRRRDERRPRATPRSGPRPATKVDGSSESLMGGVCPRTPQVRKELVSRVRSAQSNTALTCADVTQAHLGALTAKLDLDRPRHYGASEAATSRELSALTALDLSDNRLTTLPAGRAPGAWHARAHDHHQRLRSSEPRSGGVRPP